MITTDEIICWLEKERKTAQQEYDQAMQTPGAGGVVWANRPQRFADTIDHVRFIAGENARLVRVLSELRSQVIDLVEKGLQAPLPLPQPEPRVVKPSKSKVNILPPEPERFVPEDTGPAPFPTDDLPVEPKPVAQPRAMAKPTIDYDKILTGAPAAPFEADAAPEAGLHGSVQENPGKAEFLGLEIDQWFFAPGSGQPRRNRIGAMANYYGKMAGAKFSVRYHSRQGVQGFKVERIA